MLAIDTISHSFDSVHICSLANFINLRLKKLNDFVSVVLVPDGKNGVIKLLNTGKINLYIHGFEINGKKDYFKKGRIIAAGPLDYRFLLVTFKKYPSLRNI